MTVSAAKYSIDIGANTQQAISAISDVSTALASLAGPEVALVVEPLAKMVEAIAIPAVEVADTAIHMAADYETAMNNLQVTTSATEAEMSKFDELFKNLSIFAGVDMTTVVEGITQLSRAGLDLNEVYDAAAGVMEIAAVGNLNTAEAADIATTAMNTFGLSGTQVSDVADLLTGTIRASTAEVGEIRNAYQMAGTVFADAGMSIEDLTVSIGMMSNAGIHGSAAGSSLKQALLSIVDPTEDAKTTMEKYGISIYDTQGNMLSWEGIIDQFSTQLGGLSDEQRNAAMNTIFSSDAMAAASIVMTNGADAYVQAKDSIMGQADASEQAAGQLEGLGGALDRLDAAFGTALIAAIEPFEDEIVLLIDGIVGLLNIFTNMDEGLRKILVSFVALPPAISMFLIPITAIQNGIRQASETVKLLNENISEMIEKFYLFDFTSDIFDRIGDSTLPAADAIGKLGDSFVQTVERISEGNDQINSNTVDFFEKQIASGKSAIEIANEYVESQMRIAEQTEVTWQNGISIGEIFSNVAKLFVRSQLDVEGANKAVGEAIFQTADNYNDYATAMETAGLATDLLTEAQWNAAMGLDYSAKAITDETEELKSYYREIRNSTEATDEAGDSFDELARKAEEALNSIKGIALEKLNLAEQLMGAGTSDYVDLTLDSLQQQIQNATSSGEVASLTQQYNDLALATGRISESSLLASQYQGFVTTAYQQGLISAEDYSDAVQRFNEDVSDGNFSLQAYLESLGVAPEIAAAFIESMGGLEAVESGMTTIGTDGVVHLNNAEGAIKLIDEAGGDTASGIQTNFVDPVVESFSILANETLPPLVETITTNFSDIRDVAAEAATRIVGIQTAASNLKEWADNHSIEIQVNVNQSGSVPTIDGTTTIAQPGGAIGVSSVVSGRSYYVGERGPEPFFPAVNGRILSNAEAREALAGGGRGNTYNISIQGGDSQSTVNKLMREMRRQEVLHG